MGYQNTADQLIGAPFSENNEDRFEQNLQVHQEAAVVDVVKIQQYHIFEEHLTSAGHLPESRNTGPYNRSLLVPILVDVIFVRQAGTGPDEAHFAPQHIDELR